MHTALLLEMAADGLGARIALGSLSFARVLAGARRVGAWIAASEVRNVAYVGLNSIAFPLAMFGASLAGRPFAPLNYRLPDADLRRLLARLAPSLAIVDDAVVGRVTGIEGVRVVPRSECLRIAAESSGEPATGNPPEPDEIAVLLFTSGTTGDAKAAVLRHRHLTSYVFSSVEFMAAADDEAALISVPRITLPPLQRC
jgi:acyl-CoA synthetase (AMP-forming)/AMP-acid ligase II